MPADIQPVVRVYADSSVYGGAFDEEFSGPSRRFFDQVRSGRFELVISPIVADELTGAPADVRSHFEEFLALSGVSIVPVSAAAIRLQQAYLGAGIVAPRWETDALHVAVATVAACRIIVSWNFKHIVHFQKIPQYVGVNLASGYQPIGIHTPQEVVLDEDQDKDI